jgi:putative transposase
MNNHWVLVIMGQFTRRIIGLGAHAGVVNGIALCHMHCHNILYRM